MDAPTTASFISEIDSSVLTSIVGLIGTAVGGLISFLASRAARKTEWNLEMKEKDYLRKESLFGEFLTEANRLMTKSMSSKVEDGEEFALITSLESKIWLHSDDLGKLARRIVVKILEAHSASGKENEDRFPSLKDTFVAECKKTLAKIQK